MSEVVGYLNLFSVDSRVTWNLVSTRETNTVKALGRRAAIAVADLALTRVHREEACYVTPVFQWVPSHCGLWGNERVDFLAQKGTGILQNFCRDLTLHSAKLENKRIFRESFRLTASRVARDKPWSTLCKESHGIPSSPRAAAVAKFRLLTGHDCLCADLFRFNL
ncbi:uncharacterized protein LOC103524116 [Trichonephila clavipes]|nr:uncharacterized protein LOC103524116 [Trichonephila clavipes]